MQIKQATITYFTPERGSSSVKIHDLIPDPNSPTTRFRFPFRQSLIVTTGTNASYAASVLTDGKLESRFSKDDWENGQFTFRTQNPNKVKVVTIYRDCQLPQHP